MKKRTGIKIEAFLLFQLLFGFALASLSFLAGFSIGPWQYWATIGIVLGSAALCSWRVFFYVLAINVVVLVLSVFTYSYAHVDSSICHLPATHFMVEGWNPVLDSSLQVVKHYFALAGMPEVKDFAALHVLTVPKFSHILASQVQSTFGLFTAMGYPFWIMCVSLALIAYRFAKEHWHVGGAFAVSFAVLVCSNFIILENSFLGLVDYVTYAGIAISVLALILWTESLRYCDLFLFFASSVVVLCNKLNGLIVLFLILMLACIWGWRERQMRWGMLIFFLSLSVFCILPYWSAAWHHGSPLYPAHSFKSGVELVDLTADFIGNSDAEKMGYFARIVYAWVSRPLALWGSSLWHGVVDFSPQWKWDFLSNGCHAGFCIFFWSGILLSLLRKLSKVTIVSWALFLAFLLMPIKYIGYARYVSYVYLIGILLWTNECALSSFMRRRMTILISSIALVIFLIDGRIFVRQISYEDSRQQSFNYIGKFGYACALKEGSEWWEYSLRTRMAACGLSFSGPKETDVVKLEILWPLVFAVDDIISNRDFLSIVGVKSRALNPIIRYKKNGSKNDE